MIKIETERLILREYQKTDWEAVHSYGQQADILIYEAWGPNSEADTKAFIEKVIIDSKKQPRMAFELCITLKSNGKLIGGCGFRIHKENLNKGDFGYIIHPDYWNKGFATEAAKALLYFMVKNKDIKKIEATCDRLNIASQRVLKKCGLQNVGVVKQDFEMKGRLRDTYFFEKNMQ